MNTSNGLMLVVSLTLFFIGIILAIAWIFLPFYIIGRLGKILAVLEKLLYETQSQRIAPQQILMDDPPFGCTKSTTAPENVSVS